MILDSIYLSNFSDDFDGDYHFKGYRDGHPFWQKNTNDPNILIYKNKYDRYSDSGGYWLIKINDIGGAIPIELPKFRTFGSDWNSKWYKTDIHNTIDVSHLDGIIFSTLFFIYVDNLDGTCYINGWDEIKSGHTVSQIINLFIPSILDGLITTAIDDETFSGCSSMISLTISDNLFRIGSYAFEGCQSLKTLNIPNNITEIGSHAFYGCTSLNSLTISNSILNIQPYTFFGCSSLINLTIPDNIINIDNESFSGCSSLTTLTIGDGVTSIGDRAFSNCTSLPFATFLGNAPSSFGADVFLNAPAGFYIEYCEEATGWTNPWNGYNTQSISCENSSSSSSTSSSSSFNALDFSGLKSWHDASISESLTYSTGSSVIIWDDLSGNNFHLNQPTLSKQPQDTGNINGLKAINFDGIDDFMNTLNGNPLGTSGNQTQSLSLFFVYKVKDISHKSPLFSQDNYTFESFAPNNQNEILFSVNTSTTTNVNWAYNGEIILVSFHVNVTENKMEIYKNGLIFASDNFSNSITIDNYLNIGGNQSHHTKTEIGEIVILSGIMPLQEREKMEGYLSHKWNITNNLPSIHPYKNVEP